MGVFLLILIVGTVLYVIIGRAIHSKSSAIQSDTGVQENVTIKINGIEQELCIRGENVNNPVILFLHGGPGSPVGYFDYYWQPYLNEDYTIVSFNQRGCGRTYYQNPETEVSWELILDDIDAIVDYLTERFEQDQIVIM